MILFCGSTGNNTAETGKMKRKTVARRQALAAPPLLLLSFGILGPGGVAAAGQMQGRQGAANMSAAVRPARALNADRASRDILAPELPGLWAIPVVADLESPIVSAGVPSAARTQGGCAPAARPVPQEVSVPRDSGMASRFGEEGGVLGLAVGQEAATLGTTDDSRLFDGANPEHRALQLETLSLARKFLVAATPDMEALLSADAVSSRLRQYPRAASQELGQALLEPMKKHLESLRFRSEINPVHTLGEVRIPETEEYVPTERVQMLFKLYRDLIEANPDLIPEDIGSIIAATYESKILTHGPVPGHRGKYGMVAPKVLPSSPGNQIVLWAFRAMGSLAQAVETARPDSLRFRHLFAIYDSIRRNKEALLALHNEIKEDRMLNGLGGLFVTLPPVAMVACISESVWVAGILLLFIVAVRTCSARATAREGQALLAPLKGIEDFVTNLIHQKLIDGGSNDEFLAQVARETNGQWLPKKGFEKFSAFLSDQ